MNKKALLLFPMLLICLTSCGEKSAADKFHESLLESGYSKGNAAKVQSEIATALELDGFEYLMPEHLTTYYYITSQGTFTDGDTYTYVTVVCEADALDDYALRLQNNQYSVNVSSMYFWGYLFPIGYQATDKDHKVSVELVEGQYPDTPDTQEEPDYFYFNINLFEIDYETTLTSDTGWNSATKSAFNQYQDNLINYVPFVTLSEHYEVEDYSEPLEEGEEEDYYCEFAIYDYNCDYILDDYGTLLTTSYGYSYDSDWDVYTKTIDDTHTVEIALGFNFGNMIIITGYGFLPAASEPAITQQQEGDFFATLYSFQGLKDKADLSGDWALEDGQCNLNLDKGSGSTVPTYYANGDSVRVYANSVMTISAKDGYAIDSVSVMLSSTTTSVAGAKDGSQLTVTGGTKALSADNLQITITEVTGPITVTLPGTSGHLRVEAVSVVTIPLNDN